MNEEILAGAFGNENGTGHRLSRAIARAFPGSQLATLREHMKASGA